MVNCVVKGCSSNNKKKDFDKNLNFFSFPRNEDLARQWKIACNIQKNLKVRYLRVCSLHFKDDDLSLKDQLLKNVSKRPRLKEDTVPSLLLPKCAIETERTKRMENRKRKLIVEECLNEYKRTKETHYDENLIPVEVASDIDQLENFRDDKSVQTEIDIECAREFHIMKLEKEIRRLKKILAISQMQSAINRDFETTDFTISNKKCGEIFVKTDETFYIVCTFCIIPFTEFTQFTKHHVHNHSDKYNNLSEGECDQIDAINIESYDGFSDSNSNFSVSEINQCNDGVADMIDLNTNDDLLLLNESSEIDKITITENEEKSTKILKKKRNRKTSLIFSCDLCEKKFSSEENVEKHKKYDHIPLDPFVDSVNVSNACIEINPRKCRYCGNIYSRKSQRIIHERIHTGERPYKCEFCDKRFSCLAHCKRHEKIHIGIKSFKCDICNKSFSQKSYLTTHIRRHKGEKFYSCSYCDKTFYLVTEKKVHERVHTGERPYQCNLCGYCFARQPGLYTHIRRIHRSVIGYVRPHECEVCTESFLTKDELRKHATRHSDLRPFPCEICGKAFKLPNALKLHEISHSSETKYVCQICGKGFKHNSGLCRHKKIHGTNPQK